jgi:uncharacterized OsmC-like protein
MCTSTPTVDKANFNLRRMNMNFVGRPPNQDVINGVDVGYVKELAGKISADEDYGKFQFRAHNRWRNGGKSSTTIQGFFAGGKEDASRKHALNVDSDQPGFLGGENTAPNPVEHLLHSLTSCLTTTLTYHAAVQGISIGAIETSAVGDLNSSGFFGVSDDVRKGYERIAVTMEVESDASPETLKELALYSPVYEMLSKSTPIDFHLTTV